MTGRPFKLTTSRGTFRVALDGDEAAPALVLCNSLGTTLEMWTPQVAAFSARYRVIRHDMRGHGGSPLTEGPYRVERLGQDVLAILDALQVEKAAFCGVSLGGHTGLWLGIHAGSRFRAITVCNSAAKIGTAAGWHERAAMVRQQGVDGMKSLAASAPGRWFTDAFVRAEPGVVQGVQAQIAGIDPEGYASCCDALADSDLRADIGRITVPTLLVAGQADPVTTVDDAKAMQAAISGAGLSVLPTSHLSNLEQPEAFNAAVMDFLETVHRD